MPNLSYLEVPIHRLNGDDFDVYECNCGKVWASIEDAEQCHPREEDEEEVEGD